MKKNKHIGSDFMDDVKEWEKEPGFRKAVEACKKKRLQEVKDKKKNRPDLYLAESVWMTIQVYEMYSEAKEMDIMMRELPGHIKDMREALKNWKKVNKVKDDHFERV